jgi:HD-like signal output (HDOD) protein
MLDQIIRGSLAACCAQFPRRCSCCRREFASFADYLSATVPIGLPLLDPIEDDEPVGALGFANCACKTTIALRYEDVSDHTGFNRAILAEAAHSKRTDVDVLAEVVAVVQRLARSGATSTTGDRDADDEGMLHMGAALRAVIDRGNLTLPRAPTAALRVRALALTEGVEPFAVARAIAADAGLAAAVLRAANTAQLARGGEVTSLMVAIARLGLDQIANIAMAAGVGEAFTRRGPFATQRHLLWRRTLLTALITRDLARSRGLDADDGFVAGLFSSLGAMIGTLAIEVVLTEQPDLPARPWRWWLRLLEVFAADFGQGAAKAWGLPSLISEVAADPHALRTGATPYVFVVAAASRVATLALEKPSLGVDDLVGERLVRDADRAVMVRAVTAAFDGLSSFTDAAVPVTANAAVVSEAVSEMCAPRMPLTAVINGAVFNVVGVGDDDLMLSGPQVIAETSLVAVELAQTPPLRFWAVTTALVSIKPPRMVVSPVAVDADTWRRLKALLPIRQDD